MWAMARIEEQLARADMEIVCPALPYQYTEEILEGLEKRERGLEKREREMDQYRILMFKFTDGSEYLATALEVRPVNLGEGQHDYEYFYEFQDASHLNAWYSESLLTKRMVSEDEVGETATHDKNEYSDIENEINDPNTEIENDDSVTEIENHDSSAEDRNPIFKRMVTTGEQRARADIEVKWSDLLCRYTEEEGALSDIEIAWSALSDRYTEEISEGLHKRELEMYLYRNMKFKTTENPEDLAKPLEVKAVIFGEGQHDYQYFLEFRDDFHLNGWYSERIMTKLRYAKDESDDLDNEYEKPKFLCPIERERRALYVNNEDVLPAADDGKMFVDGWVENAIRKKQLSEHFKVSYIKSIEFGVFNLRVRYYSPFPAGFDKLPKFVMCQFCLKFVNNHEEFQVHKMECDSLVPGELIYLKGSLRVYEARGNEHRTYCQSLCLLGKLFIEHKIDCFCVTKFAFYVLFADYEGASHFVGYFSIDRTSFTTMSSVFVLPPLQRKGYGYFLIALSYEVTKRNHFIGTPERPLTESALEAHFSYWTNQILDYLNCVRYPSIQTSKKISVKTNIAKVDVIETLKRLGMAKLHNGVVVANIKNSVLRRRLDSSKLPVIPLDIECLTSQIE